MKVYVLENLIDIYSGLALEQTFFQQRALQTGFSSTSEDITVLFWQSNSALVIGRNQNPWMECSFPELKRAGALLSRRESGGGAVYHDKENLNISIISSQNGKQIEANLYSFQLLLSELGLRVEINKHNDILLNGEKISGSAMRYSKQTLLHHFTILLAPDSKLITRILCSPHAGQIVSRGVPSRRSTVTGTKLSYEQIHRKFLSDDRYAQILRVRPDYMGSGRNNLYTEYISDLNIFLNQSKQQRIFHVVRKKLSSEEWIYGHTPRFLIRLSSEQGDEYTVEFRNGRLHSLHNKEKDKTLIAEEPIFMQHNSLRSYIKKGKIAILKKIVQQILTMYYGG